MTDSALKNFESRAAGYEVERRRVVPGYDAFYEPGSTDCSGRFCPALSE